MAQGIIINISGSGEGAAEALRQIEAKMQQTAAKGKESSELLASAWSKVEGILSTLGISAGIAEGISKIKEMITSSMELGVELGHLSQQTGISAENLSVLKFAAGETGIEFDTLIKGFKKLSTEIDNADQGSATAVKTFARLGITQADLKAKGNDLYGVLGMIGDKFKDMPDGIEKNALATQLFGRAGQALIPILNEGADGIARLKAQAPVFTQEDIEKMEELHKATADLEAAWQRTSVTITGTLAPAMIWYLGNFAEGLVVIGDKAKDAWNWVAKLSKVPNGPSFAWDEDKPHPPGAPVAKPKAPPPPPGSGGDTGGSDGSILYPAPIAYGIRSVTSAPMRDKALAAEQRLVQARQDEYDTLKLCEGVAEAIAKADKESADAAAGVRADYQKRMDTQGAAIDAKLADQQAQREAGETRLRTEEARQAARTIGGFMDQLTSQALSGKISFRSMVDSIIMDLERFAMKVMEERTIMPMLNSLFGVTGGSGGGSSSGAFVPTAGQFFAGGGDIDSGWAVVGDGGNGSGSEIFAPKGPGTILPHNVLEGLAASRGGGGGAPNVTVNTINNSSNQVTQRQAGVSWDAQARSFVIHTVLEDMQQGGPMSAAMQGFAPK